MKTAKPVVLLTCLIALLCSGWGYEGHRIVGAIAWSYLTPEAKAAVAKLLENEGNGTLSEATTWADRCQLRRAELCQVGVQADRFAVVGRVGEDQ